METKTQFKEKDDSWYFDDPCNKVWHVPGRILMLGFRDPFPMGDSIGFMIVTPAVVLNTRLHAHRPPTHDVGFWTRWNSGEVSGMLVLQCCYPSRYEIKNRQPCTSEIESLADEDFSEYGFDHKSLFYTEEVSFTERNLIYPFR